jgi:hypothetical protein
MMRDLSVVARHALREKDIDCCMTEETPRRFTDEAQEAEEPVFRHLDKTEQPDLRTIKGMAGLLNFDQQAVMLAVNRLERDGRIFGERKRAGGLETWRTDNTPPSIIQPDL